MDLEHRAHALDTTTIDDLSRSLFPLVPRAQDHGDSDAAYVARLRGNIASPVSVLYVFLAPPPKILRPLVVLTLSSKIQWRPAILQPAPFRGHPWTC